MPFYPQSATSWVMCLDFLLFRCFHFRFTFESIKEFGSVSHGIKALGRARSTYWRVLMAPKRIHKPVHETMVEEPTQDQEVSFEAIREEE